MGEDQQGTDSTQFFSKRALSNLEFHGDHTQIASSFKSFHLSSLLKPDFGDLAVFRSPFGQFCYHPDTPLPSSFSSSKHKGSSEPLSGFCVIIWACWVICSQSFLRPKASWFCRVWHHQVLRLSRGRLRGLLHSSWPHASWPHSS